MDVKLVYFAWVRERIGKAEETRTIPGDVTTIAELLGWLSGQGEAYANAFKEPGIIRAAIDQTHVKPDAPIVGAREIAFFPPVTGG